MKNKADYMSGPRIRLIGMASDLRKKGKTLEEIYEILSKKHTNAQIDDAIRVIHKADENRKKTQ